MFEKLNQTAAIAARDGVEIAIKSLESRIKIKLDDVNPSAKDYFVAQQKEDRAAIAQLRRMSADLHKRVFDAAS